MSDPKKPIQTSPSLIYYPDSDSFYDTYTRISYVSSNELAKEREARQEVEKNLDTCMIANQKLVNRVEYLEKTLEVFKNNFIQLDREISSLKKNSEAFKQCALEGVNNK